MTSILMEQNKEKPNLITKAIYLKFWFFAIFDTIKCLEVHHGRKEKLWENWKGNKWI